jgi:hypothetical protein
MQVFVHIPTVYKQNNIHKVKNSSMKIQEYIFSLSTFHLGQAMIYVFSWIKLAVGGTTEFMKRKLATGGVFIALFWLHSVINCIKIIFTYKVRQRNGGDCLHEWLQNT